MKETVIITTVASFLFLAAALIEAVNLLIEIQVQRLDREIRKRDARLEKYQ